MEAFFSKIAEIITTVLIAVFATLGISTDLGAHTPDHITSRGWNYDRVDFVENGIARRAFEWILGEKNYLSADGWKEIKIKSATTTDGFEMTTAPFEVYAPKKADGVMKIVNNVRFHIGLKTVITEAPLDMEITAQGVSPVDGVLTDEAIWFPNSVAKAKPEAYLYRNAYLTGDLLYFPSNYGKSRFNKIIRFTSKPATSEIIFNFCFSRGMVIIPSPQKANKVSLNSVGVFKRGFDINPPQIWDSGGKTQKTEFIDYTLLPIGGGCYKFTKILPLDFWDTAVGDVYTDVSIEANPDKDADANTTMDGEMINDDTGSTWDAVHDEVLADVGLNDASPSFRIFAQDHGDGRVRIGRAVAYFDTSAIPASDTVDEASLTLYVETVTSGDDCTTGDNDGDDLITITQVAAQHISSSTQLAFTDYNDIFNATSSPADIKLREMINISERKDISDNGTNGTALQFVFNATGTAAIAKSGEENPSGAIDAGITYLGIVGGHDFLDNPIAVAQEKCAFGAAENTGTTEEIPRLYATTSAVAVAEDDVFQDVIFFNWIPKVFAQE